MNPSTRQRWARLALWSAIVLWVAGGPLVKQGLGVDVPGVRKWTMFHKYGRSSCTVEYHAVQEDGSLQSVDWLAALGHGAWHEAPKDVRLITSVDEAKRVARTLCFRLEEPDIRANLVCGTRKGWRRRMSGRQNLCFAG